MARTGHATTAQFCIVNGHSESVKPERASYRLPSARQRRLLVASQLRTPEEEAAVVAIRERDAPALARVLARAPSLVANPDLLIEAADESADCCSVLLDAGADIEAIDPTLEGYPLKRAASTGTYECAELLLSRGALVNGLPIVRATPLMLAAAEGHLEVAKLLVEHGADIDHDGLGSPSTALSLAEELAPLKRSGQDKVAEYLRSVGATKPWDYHRHEDFWDGAVGELTILFVESCLGNVCAIPLVDSKSEHSRIVVRRTRHGWRSIFQTVFTCGLPSQGAPCEVGLCLTSRWPLHRRALENEQFARPAGFLGAVADRLLAGAALHHGDVLDRDHPLVAELAWPGEFNQWLLVQHQSFEERRREVADPDLPVILFLVPHLGKKPLKAGADARAKADHKASVKWEKPAANGGKNNLVVPLCYDAPWLKGAWF